MIISLNGQRPQPIQLAIPFDSVINPCLSCQWQGMCDNDECGRKSYPLDLPTTRFKNLGEYIRFIKHYDWL